jgi:FkbM family methyltransferase
MCSIFATQMSRNTGFQYISCGLVKGLALVRKGVGLNMLSGLKNMSMIKRLVSPFWQRLSGLPPVTDRRLESSDLQRLLKTDSPLIIEIGANDGTHTAWFKNVFPSAVIHCFEPDQRAACVFRERFKDMKDVHLYEMAVGAISGEADFYPSVGRAERDWTASGSLHRPTGHLEVHPSISFGSPIKIRSVRLDEWCRQRNIKRVDFIWMDVQGAEFDVFAGAKESLAMARFLYTEYSIQSLYENQPSLKQVLGRRGDFSTLTRYHNDILLRNTKIN